MLFEQLEEAVETFSAEVTADYIWRHVNNHGRKFHAPAWNSLNHCMWLMKSPVKEKRVRFGIFTVRNLLKHQAAPKYFWIKHPPSSKWYFTALVLYAGGRPISSKSPIQSSFANVIIIKFRPYSS